MEDDFELSTVCHRPESMDKLQEQTKFTKKELQVLYRGFKNVGLAEEESNCKSKNKPKKTLVLVTSLWELRAALSLACLKLLCSPLYCILCYVGTNEFSQFTFHIPGVSKWCSE